MRRALVLCSALAILGLQGVATTAPAQGAHHAARPDLTVSRGEVTLAGSTLTGWFSVKNKGVVRARKTSASLSLQVAGKDQLVQRFSVKAVRPGASRRVRFSVPEPLALPGGALAVSVCADDRHRLKERSERNNCRVIANLLIPTDGRPPTTSVPTHPVPFTKNTVFTLTDTASNYWVDVPTAYDSSHQTPMTLFVWLHGCGGQSQYDISTVSPGGSGQTWISVAVGGAEGSCWQVNSDSSTVLAAIADIKTHFNVNPRRVIIGGYSSGGDLAYRTAFYNANTFAGVLAENTSPFRDTGSSGPASLAAAAWKFHVAHLAHLQDTTYPIAGVRTETEAMKAAGFPLTRIERNGGHYDNPGTDADLATYLFPYLDAGWLAPA